MDPDLRHRRFYRHSYSTSHLTFDLDRNGNIEQRNAQAASAVVTAVGPVVVVAVGVNVAGPSLYQGWNDTSRAWMLERV